MKVAIVSDAVPPFNKGGKETRLANVLHAFPHAGIEANVYTMKWWDGPNEMVVDGIRYIAIGRRRDLYKGPRRSMIQAVLFGLATLKLLGRDFDILDVDHMPFFPVISARVVCSLRRKPLVGTWHEYWGPAYWGEYLGTAGWAAALVERLALSLPDAIISNSAFTTDRLRRAGVRVPVHTAVLGADVADLDNVEASDVGFDAMYAGRLLSHKHVDDLIRAVGLVIAEFPDFRCSVVGGGPEGDSLRALVAELDLEKHVEIDGFFSDHAEVIARMKSCRMVVLPSRREGFGMVVLEANAVGTPVVTVGHPDNAAASLIEDRLNGLVVTPDPEGIAGGICWILRNGDAMAPRDVAARYSWERTVEVVSSVYRGLARARP